MSLSKLISCLIIAGSTVISQPSWAADIWVKDVSAFYLRSQPSDNFKRIETLYSGDKLTVIKKDSSGQFYQVKSAQGNTGWIGIKNVLSKPVAKVLLADLEKAHAQLQSDFKKIKTKTDNADNEITLARQERDQAISERDQSLNIAGNAPQIQANNKTLNDEKVKLKQQIDGLQNELASLQSKGNNQQMFVGGGLVALGFVLALIGLAFKGKRHRNGWNN